jgi:hypothetical protein
MQMVVYVLSSDGVTQYAIKGLLDNTKLKLYCECQSGVMGKFCKHRIELIEGDLKNIGAKTNKSSLDILLEWIRVSNFPLVVRELREFESAEIKAKSNVTAFKKKVGLMMEGKI